MAADSIPVRKGVGFGRRSSRAGLNGQCQGGRERCDDQDAEFEPAGERRRCLHSWRVSQPKGSDKCCYLFVTACLPEKSSCAEFFVPRVRKLLGSRRSQGSRRVEVGDAKISSAVKRSRSASASGYFGRVGSRKAVRALRAGRIAVRLGGRSDGFAEAEAGRTVPRIVAGLFPRPFDKLKGQGNKGQGSGEQAGTGEEQARGWPAGAQRSMR